MHALYSSLAAIIKEYKKHVWDTISKYMVLKSLSHWAMISNEIQQKKHECKN